VTRARNGSSAACTLIVALALSGCGARGESAVASDGKVDIGRRVPTYATLSLDGDSVSLSKERGKVVLLNIWATWCHPCRTEIPELRALHAQYGGKGLDVVGVSIDAEGTDESIRGFMRDYEITYPIWRDADERVSSLFKPMGVPATYLIDKLGVLRWQKTGPIAPNDTALTAAIERALGT
jgi:thiol-disulfide isomerase/thioredoxin